MKGLLFFTTLVVICILILTIGITVGPLTAFIWILIFAAIIATMYYTSDLAVAGYGQLKVKWEDRKKKKAAKKEAAKNKKQ